MVVQGHCPRGRGAGQQPSSGGLSLADVVAGGGLLPSLATAWHWHCQAQAWYYLFLIKNKVIGYVSYQLM